jgi:hypothetical protein
MGAFVGALFARNTNKTNNKQCVNRGYDSRVRTTIQSRLVSFARCDSDGYKGEPRKHDVTLLLVVEERLLINRLAPARVFSRLIFARNLFNIK